MQEQPNPTGRNVMIADEWTGMPAAVFNESYMEGVIRETSREPVTMVSCAPDKSRVGSIGLSSSPFLLPSGTAFWGCPQELPPLYILSGPHEHSQRVRAR